MNKVYLVGMPASGKTTIAQQLAQNMGYAFIDLDQQLIAKFNAPIERIFEEIGEDQFRIAEQLELQNTQTLSNAIISTGGGCAAHFDNMDWMLKNGLTLFINTSLTEISARIAQNSSERPLFKNLEPPQIEEKILKMAEFRNPFYSKSKLIWNTGVYNKSLQVAVSQLISVYS